MTCLQQLDCLMSKNMQIELHKPQITICAHSKWIKSLILFIPIHSIRNQDYSKLIVSTGYDESIRIWDPISTHCIEKFIANTKVNCMEILSYYDRIVNEYKQVLFTGEIDGMIEVWDLKELKHLKSLKNSSTTSILSITCKTNPSKLTSPTVSIESLEFNYSLIITAESKHQIKIRNWIKGIILYKINTKANVEKLLFVRVCNMDAIFATNLKNLDIWNLNRKIAIKRFSGHKDWLRGIDIMLLPYENKKSLVVLTTGDDKTIKLWNYPSGVCLRTIDGHQSFISMIKGSYIQNLYGFYTLDIGGNLIYWSINGEKLIEICSGLNSDGLQNALVFQVNNNNNAKNEVLIAISGLYLNRSYHNILIYKSNKL